MGRRICQEEAETAPNPDLASSAWLWHMCKCRSRTSLHAGDRSPGLRPSDAWLLQLLHLHRGHARCAATVARQSSCMLEMREIGLLSLRPSHVMCCFGGSCRVTSNGSSRTFCDARAAYLEQPPEGPPEGQQVNWPSLSQARGFKDETEAAKLFVDKSLTTGSTSKAGS